MGRAVAPNALEGILQHVHLPQTPGEGCAAHAGKIRPQTGARLQRLPGRDRQRLSFGRHRLGLAEIDHL